MARLWGAERPGSVPDAVRDTEHLPPWALAAKTQEWRGRARRALPDNGYVCHKGSVDGLSLIDSLPAAPLRPWAPCVPIVRVDSPFRASEVGVRELHDNGFSRRGLGVADSLYLSSG